MSNLPQRLINLILRPLRSATPHQPVSATLRTDLPSARGIYSTAAQANWGLEAEAPQGCYSSYLDRSYREDLAPVAAAEEEMASKPRRNRRRRLDLVGLTAFPNPRGLCVAHGGRST